MAIPANLCEGVSSFPSADSDARYQVLYHSLWKRCLSSHAFSMHESTGTERDDNLIVPSGLKKETIFERTWPGHGSKRATGHWR